MMVFIICSAQPFSSHWILQFDNQQKVCSPCWFILHFTQWFTSATRETNLRRAQEDGGWFYVSKRVGLHSLMMFTGPEEIPRSTSRAWLQQCEDFIGPIYCTKASNTPLNVSIITIYDDILHSLYDALWGHLDSAATNLASLMHSAFITVLGSHLSPYFMFSHGRRIRWLIINCGKYVESI